MSTIDSDSGEIVPDGATQPFPNPGEVSLDHAAQAASRVIAQYQKATRFLAHVAGLAALAQRIENCLNSIPGLLAIASDNPSSTTNVNLDNVGALVGQSRVLADGTVLTNAQFLVVIGLRIARNTSIASSPEFIAALTAILGVNPFRYYDIGGMMAGVELATGGGAPAADIVAEIDALAPRAMGVDLVRIWYGTTYFGFDEDHRSGVRGFGEIGNPSVGAPFGELF